jgi:response regulator RpfG family c-di-GMP phosphodiesterase
MRHQVPAVFRLASYARWARASQMRLYVSRGDVARDSPTVLCIDDRPQLLEFRKATLESHGYSVKIASSGYAAIKMLQETSVAVVLLEYKLEGMDAEAVAYQIKHAFPACRSSCFQRTALRLTAHPKSMKHYEL